MKIDEKTILESIDYKSYRDLVEKLFKEGKSTGTVQSEELLHYTELNIHRMNRVEKTTILTEELKGVLRKIDQPQIWLILTEGWCGDAAQTVPIFNSIEKEFPNIKVRLILRDEHLALMDKFLTNGGRSIPKVLMLDATSLDLLAHWGPRPKEASHLIDELKTAQADLSEIKEKLHFWYAKNRGKAVQAELVEILESTAEKSN